ncbi:MAG: putative metal-binding motif-containing protein [Polyangiaceae bacterium]|nr:putative metal-binding motif-containing protein [Polyangiaceae bacterium]
MPETPRPSHPTPRRRVAPLEPLRAQAATLALTLCASLLAGCSSESVGCGDTHTCGAAGAAGSAGAGGQGGAAGGAGRGTQPECVADPDCDDGLGCNGEEQCLEGRCVGGTPFECANPDAKHCALGACEETAGGPRCQVTALDADSDGHPSAACAASPGDDCDDENAAVHPSATELCNGIDDDCDGKLDLDDGLVLSGSNAAFVSVSGDVLPPKLAWGPNSKTFGVVWADEHTGTSKVYFQPMSSAGTAFGDVPLAITGGTSSPSSENAPAIAWGETRFGIAWEDSDGSVIRFTRVGADGFRVDKPVTLGNGWNPAVTWDAGTKQHIVTWADDDTLFARRVKQDGTLGNVLTIETTSAHFGAPSAAFSGSTLGLVAENSTDAAWSSSKIRFATLTGAPALLGAIDLTSAPPRGLFNSGPAIAGASAGFSIVWQPSTSLLDTTLRYEERRADRSLACGPVELDDGFMRPAIVTHPSGSVIATIVRNGSSGVGRIGLWRIAPGCKPAAKPTLVMDGVPTALPSIAFGEGKGFAVLWGQENPTTGKHEIWSRTFGPRYCD